MKKFNALFESILNERATSIDVALSSPEYFKLLNTALSKWPKYSKEYEDLNNVINFIITELNKTFNFKDSDKTEAKTFLSMCLHNADSEWINYIKSGYKLEEDKEEEKPIFIFKGKEYLPQGNDPKSYKNEAIAYFCRNNKNENYMSILHRITKK